MPNSVRLLRPLVPCLLTIAMLDACGGGGGAAAGPTPNELSEASSANLRSTLDLETNRVTLQWWPDISTTSRYQIEQQDSSGGWVVIDGLWGSTNTTTAGAIGWTGALSGTTTFRVEAVRPGYTVPLSTLSPQSTSITVAAPAQIPSIEFDQAQSLDGPISISLGNAGTYEGVTYALDKLTQQVGVFGPSPQSPDYATTVTPDGYTTGTHRLYALLQLNDSSTAVIGRDVQIHYSKAAVQLFSTVLNSPGFDAYVIATSDSGIASVVATVNQVPLDTLMAPNACVPMPCGAGQAFNAYHFFVDAKHLPSSYLYINVIATDNAGNTAATGATFATPAPPNATLDSPVDGAMVSGSLHISGTFSAPTPGPLEVLVALSGVTVYDTTVANTGEIIPYAADVSLAGVAPGSHTLSVFSRVGNTDYRETASVVIQVAAPP